MINNSCDWAQSDLVTREEFKDLSDVSKRKVLKHQSNYNENCK